MSTTPDGRPGAVPPGAGEPENRRGQDESRDDARRDEATENLGESADKLATVVERLGGWMKTGSLKAFSHLGESISGGAKQILDDMTGAIKNELHAFGYLGEKTAQLAEASFGLMGKGASMLLTKMSEEKEAQKEIKKQAAEQAKGDKTIYEQTIKDLNEQRKKDKELEKLDKQIKKKEEKLLKAKSDAARDVHLAALKALHDQKDVLLNPKKEEEKIVEQDNNTAEKVKGPKENETEEIPNGLEILAEKIESVEKSAEKNSQSIISAIHETATKASQEQEKRFSIAEKAAEIRHTASEKMAEMRAILTALPGWLTVAAVGGLVATSGYLVYTRWNDIVGGFNALKEDLLAVRDKITMAINDKIEEVVEFGNKLLNWADQLLNWAKNLIPSFGEWWKMNMPEMIGGYSETEKQAIIDAQRAAAENAQQQAAAAQQQAEALQQQADTAKQAEQATAENKNIEHQTNKPPAPANNVVNTNVAGDNKTSVNVAPNANKDSAKNPTRKNGGK